MHPAPSAPLRATLFAASAICPPLKKETSSLPFAFSSLHFVSKPLPFAFLSLHFVSKPLPFAFLPLHFVSKPLPFAFLPLHFVNKPLPFAFSLLHFVSKPLPFAFLSLHHRNKKSIAVLSAMDVKILQVYCSVIRQLYSSCPLPTQQ